MPGRAFESTPIGEFFTRSHAGRRRRSTRRSAVRRRPGGQRSLVDRQTVVWLGEVAGDLLEARSDCGADLRPECAGPSSSAYASAGVIARATWRFTGLDHVERHGAPFGFGGSIDLDKALSAEVILATELNEMPLPASYAFPAPRAGARLDRCAQRQVAPPDHAPGRAPISRPVHTGCSAKSAFTIRATCRKASP